MALVEKNHMDFSEALLELKRGEKVQRSGWNGAGMWLALQIPEEGSEMGAPYIYMRTAQNYLIPWVASQTDLLSRDWQIIHL